MNVPWNNDVLGAFDRIPAHAVEAGYNIPYTLALQQIIPRNSGFSFMPQYTPTFDGTELIDFVVIYCNAIGGRRYTPIFILELKPASHINYISTREAADDQMRSQFQMLHPYFPPGLLTVQGISAIGTRLSFYKYRVSNGAITPARIAARSQHYVNNTVPATNRGDDILDAEGANKFIHAIHATMERCVHLAAAH
ncbi:hypothetical protein BOTBODRAFT_120222 [Botryobasidium botryosum FD-172 SS1]|uniref:Fungal-type protein kinase domain-containing protein n=1 Tax=Botryobasidium botryosum (strain FD-172 SS1) TaxID=930990 RepID=A0A067M6U8_BOTB1|nr:hypothetical protein BOTBODRAFT_120222 [Botryobasidium botryosum FD-172 SS1]